MLPPLFVSGWLSFWPGHRTQTTLMVIISFEGREMVEQVSREGNELRASDCVVAWQRARARGAVPDGAAELDADGQPIIHPALGWAGLDMDVDALDRDILILLARLAPPDGALRALGQAAHATKAAAAAEADAELLCCQRADAAGGDLNGGDAPRERALRYMARALAALGDAQTALFVAHEAWADAQAALR